MALPACGGSRIDMAQCDVVVRSGAQPDLPSGWGTPDLVSAYKLPTSTHGAGEIVAIVDSYDNPNVAADLATYRAYYGLPPAHFVKYNQDGVIGHYPSEDEGWGLEMDLDVEMVSASCPQCTIYLVEARSNNFSDIELAEARAVKLGAHVVSNSYSGSGADRSYYETPGVTYLASAGDYGYGIADPADFGSVVAVGGTVLVRDGSRRGWSESVWADSGGGCSKQSKPAWQNDTGCRHRTGNDISAVADGVAAYDSFGYGGWRTVAGTSISSPLLAGVYGLAGDASQQTGGKRFWTRKHARRHDLNHVNIGDDGTCEAAYLCAAGTRELEEYSGPAGWGTPNGIGAF